MPDDGSTIKVDGASRRRLALKASKEVMRLIWEGFHGQVQHFPFSPV